MGLDPRARIQAADADEPAIPISEVNEMIVRALERRAEMNQARETLRAAELGLDVARKTNVPALSANLGLGARGSNIVPDSSFTSLGASVQWNPFDSGLTASRTREARANLEAARAALRSTGILVTADVSQAYLNLRTAEQRRDSRIRSDKRSETVRLAEGGIAPAWAHS